MTDPTYTCDTHININLLCLGEGNHHEDKRYAVIILAVSLGQSGEYIFFILRVALGLISHRTGCSSQSPDAGRIQTGYSIGQSNGKKSFLSRCRHDIVLE